jgi:hypothetical protein
MHTCGNHNCAESIFNNTLWHIQQQYPGSWCYVEPTGALLVQVPMPRFASCQRWGQLCFPVNVDSVSSFYIIWRSIGWISNEHLSRSQKYVPWKVYLLLQVVSALLRDLRDLFYLVDGSNLRPRLRPHPSMGAEQSTARCGGMGAEDASKVE